MSCDTPFTEATVPTGMNTGVSISPCGVNRRPRRAAPAVFSIWNCVGIDCDCSNRTHRGAADALVRLRLRWRAGKSCAHPGRGRPGLHDALYTQRYDLSFDLVFIELDPSHAYRQFEAARACAAGIEIEHSGARLLLGSVTVAGDHHAKSSRFGFKVERRKIVQHIDGNAVHLEHVCFRQLARPRAGVDVATHGRDRRNGSK